MKPKFTREECIEIVMKQFEGLTYEGADRFIKFLETTGHMRFKEDVQ